MGGNGARMGPLGEMNAGSAAAVFEEMSGKIALAEVGNLVYSKQIPLNIVQIVPMLAGALVCSPHDNLSESPPTRRA